MRLSKNLTLIEAVQSETAERLGLDNRASFKVVENLIQLAKFVFQPIRDNFNEPIYISSGFRSEKLNKVLGGAKNSDHKFGRAFDINQNNKNSKCTNGDIFYFIKNNLKFKQLIWEYGDVRNPGWVHVSYELGKNKCEVLKAIKKNGKTIYMPFDI